MAATFRSKSEAHVNLGRSITISKPSGVVDGDLLVLTLACRGSQTATIPAGWTELASSPQSVSAGEATGLRTYVCWKVASSEAASYTFTNVFSANTLGTAVMTAVQNVDTGATIDASGGTSTGTAGSDVTVSSISPANAGDLLLMTGAGRNVGGTWTQQSGLVERADYNGNGETPGVFVADEALSSGGATGTRTATFSVGTNPRSGFLIAIKSSGATTHSVSASASRSSSGSAAAVVDRQASAAASRTPTSSAAAVVLAQASASATGTSTATAEAHVQRVASASGSGQSTGTAAARLVLRASASANVQSIGSAEARLSLSVAASASVQSTGEAAATQRHVTSASASLSSTSAAVAIIPAHRASASASRTATATATATMMHSARARSAHIADDFNRPDGTIVGQTTLTGQTWQAMETSGSNSTPVQAGRIISNQLIPAAVTTNQRQMTTCPVTGDQRIVAKLVVPAVVGDLQTFLSPRCANYPTEMLYVYFNGTAVQAAKGEAGAFGLLSTGPAQATWAPVANTAYTIEITWIGTRLDVYANGARILSATLTSAEQSRFRALTKWCLGWNITTVARRSQVWDDVAVYAVGVSAGASTSPAQLVSASASRTSTASASAVIIQRAAASASATSSGSASALTVHAASASAASTSSGTADATTAHVATAQASRTASAAASAFVRRLARASGSGTTTASAAAMQTNVASASAVVQSSGAVNAQRLMFVSASASRAAIASAVAVRTLRASASSSRSATASADAHVPGAMSAAGSGQSSGSAAALVVHRARAVASRAAVGTASAFRRLVATAQAARSAQGSAAATRQLQASASAARTATASARAYTRHAVSASALVQSTGTASVWTARPPLVGPFSASMGDGRRGAIMAETRTTVRFE